MQKCPARRAALRLVLIYFSFAEFHIAKLQMKAETGMIKAFSACLFSSFYHTMHMELFSKYVAQVKKSKHENGTSSLLKVQIDVAHKQLCPHLNLGREPNNHICSSHRKDTSTFQASVL